jgi:ankyrin repeat protein
MKVLVGKAGVQIDSSTTGDGNSFPSLVLAARNSRVAAVEYLIETLNATVRTKNEDGNTALHMAAMNGFAKLTALLVTKYRAGKKNHY